MLRTSSELDSFLGGKANSSYFPRGLTRDGMPDSDNLIPKNSKAILDRAQSSLFGPSLFTRLVQRLIKHDFNNSLGALNLFFGTIGAILKRTGADAIPEDIKKPYNRALKSMDSLQQAALSSRDLNEIKIQSDLEIIEAFIKTFAKYPIDKDLQNIADETVADISRIMIDCNNYSKLISLSKYEKKNIHFDEIATTVKRQAERAQADIEFEANGLESSSFTMSPIVLSIIKNLITNGQRAATSSTGATVKVCLEQNDMGGLEISIHDSGTTLPSDIYHDIFVDGTDQTRSTQDGKEHGRGLATCKQLFNALGYKLSYSNKPEKHFKLAI